MSREAASEAAAPLRSGAAPPAMAVAAPMMRKALTARSTCRVRPMRATRRPLYPLYNSTLDTAYRRVAAKRDPYNYITPKASRMITA